MKQRFPLNLQLFAEEGEVTGVEEASVAGMQEESFQDETNEQSEVHSGVEHTDVADQNNEKGFAKALKAREEQIRTQLEQEYNGRSKETERYQQSLERAARLNGYPDHESYMSALDEYEANLHIQEEADRLNVSEDFLRAEFNPIKQELSQAKTELQQLKEADMVRQVQSQLESMERNAAEYPEFTKYKNDVINMAANKGYTLDDAYIIASHHDRLNSARTQAQQETIRNLQQNADSSTGSLGADAPEHAGGYSALSPSEKKAFRESVKGRAN